MFLHQFCQPRDIIGMPMCTYEVIPLDGLKPDGCIVLPEVFLPYLSRTLANTLCLGRLAANGIDNATPRVTLHIMITIDKETGIIEAKELAFDKPVELSNLSIRNAFMDNMIMEEKNYVPEYINKKILSSSENKLNNDDNEDGREVDINQENNNNDDYNIK